MGRSWVPFVLSGALVVWGVALSMSSRTARANTPPSAVPPVASAFETTVRPILRARCQPCHFAGGKIYDHLPFDNEDVVRRLGTGRLFTRLKDEKDRAAIRAFLQEKTAR